MSMSTPTGIVTKTGGHSSYDEYEGTGADWLGEIPADWEVARLKFLADFTGGGTPSKDNREYWGGEIPWVSPKDMKAGRVRETQDQITSEAVEESSTRLVGAGSVLLVVRSGILKHTIPVATNEVEVALNQDLKAITPKERLHSRYLAYLIEGRNDTLLLKWTKSGTTVESLEQERISNTQIPVPSPEEQRAIAEYLDRETERIDALIEKKEQLIDLLEEKRTALISRVVTKGLDRDAEMQDSGVEWLGEIPAHWDTVKLKWDTDKIGSGVTPDGGSEAYVDEGITFLRSQNVHFDGLRLDDVAYIDEETDEEMEATRVQSWDVLLNITGASIGRCTLVPKGFARANVNQHVCIIRAQRNELHPPFLNHVMASSVGQEQIFAEVDGASREAVTFAEIGNFIAPKPPVDEQRRIAEQVDRRTSQIYALIEQIREGIDRLREYRTALISAAVTGQIDVREDARKPEMKEANTWDRMVLTMELIRRMRAAHHDSLGRTLLVKMVYLIQHHVRVTGMGFNYKRKDYGPYAPEFRYEVENALQSGDWIQVSEGSEQVRYELREKADSATVQGYFESSWGDVEEQIDEIVSYFHQFDAERAEIVATLYAAWNDLKILDRPYDEDAIIREVRENWHPRKREIDESRWRKALHWMKEEGLVPMGFGEPTIEKEN